MRRPRFSIRGDSTDYMEYNFCLATQFSKLINKAGKSRLSYKNSESTKEIADCHKIQWDGKSSKGGNSSGFFDGGK